MAAPLKTELSAFGQALHRLILQSGLLYWLMLAPTFLCLLYAGADDATVSRWLPQAWDAAFWGIPGLPDPAAAILAKGALLIAIGLCTALFLKGLRLIAGQSQAPAMQDASLILTGCLLLGLTLVAVVPFHSSDLYGYINRGAQQSLYAVNPYTTTVAEIDGWRSQPMFHEHWVYNPCPYGFFFARLAAWLTWLSGGHFLWAFLIFKTLNWLAFGGCLWLIFLLSGKLERKRPWLDAFWFGASPLVLLHGLANGHNDLLLVLLLLGSLATLWFPRRAWLSLPLLTLSILTKYASLLALPFIGLYLVKTRQYKALLGGLVVSGLLIWWLSLSYLNSGEPWPWKDMLDNAGKPQHSLIAGLGSLYYYPLKWFTGWDADALEGRWLATLKPVFWAAFTGFFGWRCWRFLRLPNPQRVDVVAETGLVMLVMICVISAKFHPWYLLMFYPLLLLLPEASRLREAGLWLALFQIAAFSPLQNLPVFNWLLLTATPLWLGWSGQTVQGWLLKPATNGGPGTAPPSQEKASGARH